MKKQLFTILSTLMLCIGLQAQTNLINPAGDGGFENGSTIAANGWNAVNASTDGWVVGITPTVSAGSNCAYVSPDGGTSWTYTQFSTYTSIYKDITIPAGENKLTLTFKWKATGEGASDWDNLKVFFAPTSVTPSTSAEVALAYRVGANFYNLSSASWNSATIVFVGTPGTTQRLIFSWKSDASTIGNPPAAVDEISLTSSAPGNFISIATGNWTNPTTWDANAVPTAVDNVTVSATHSVTINAASQAASNLTVNGYLSYSTTPTSFSVGANLLVSSTGTLATFVGATGKTLVVSGNFTNNGVVDLSKTSSLLNINGATSQTFDGTGTLVANTIAGLTFNNSNSSPIINWNWSNINVSGTLTFTKGWVNLGVSNKLTLGTAIATAGTLSFTSGGFTTGIFSRWWSNAGTGSATAAGADPTSTTSRYPFINSTGLNRSAWIERVSPTVGGQYSLKYTDAASNSIVAVSDGTYTVQNRYDGNWTVSTEGTSPVATTYNLVLLAPSAYQALNGNSRIIGASAILGGVHRNGTATPGAQRTGLTLAALTSGPAYIGAANADVVFPCVGAPTAGTATATSSLACSATNFTLSLTGNTSGVSGLTYQWQSSPDNATWTSIPTATLVNATVSQTTALYYQCVLTCTSTALSATSTAVQVTMNNFFNCYCVTSPSSGGVNDIITKVSVTNLLGQNLTQVSTYTAPAYFVSYNNTPLDLAQSSTTNVLSISMGNDPNQHSAAWIDFNQNGIYEASENIALSSIAGGANSTVNYTFTVPAGATLGLTRLRIRGGSDGVYSSAGACTTSAYGETEDYIVNIIPLPTCYPPTGLAISNITTTSVDLSWTAPVTGTPVSYVGEIRTSGAAGSGTLGLVSAGTVTAPTTTVNINTLTAFTAYTVYLRSDCGAGDVSIWSSVTFTTLANCQVPTALNTSTVLATLANYTWTAGGTETAWDIYYGVQPLTIPTATTAPTATSSVASYSATGLTQLTAYSVYVRANCGAGNTSIWTSVKNFTTPVSCPVPSTVAISAITPMTANAAWIAGGTESSWLVNYIAPTTTVITTSPSYTLTGLTPSTTYSIQVKAICAVGDSSIWTLSKAFTTPCLPPNILTTTPNSRCGAGTTTLGATADAGATLNWYANSTGGSALASGTVFTTPTLTTTTDFYVSSMGAIASGSGGRTTPTATANTTASSYGLVFDVVKNFTLNSVDVFPTGTAGNLVINLTNNTGAILQTATVAIPTGTVGTPYTVALNFPIAVGTGYRLIAVSSPNMIRESALGGFPYALGQVGNITSGYIGGTSTSYYFFYNWLFSYGCESARSVVTASVTTAPVLSVTNGTTICANAIKTLSITSTISDFDNYLWAPNNNLFTDAATTTPYLGGTASTLYYSSSSINNTTYTIIANNTSNGCANSAMMTMKADMPVIFSSATPTMLCSGSTVSLTANTNIITPGSVNIGLGNLTTSVSGTSSGNYVSPYSHYYGGYKAQYIVRASELTAIGLSAGNLTSLSYSVTTAGTTYSNFAISMAATSQSVATTTFDGSVSQIYGSVNTTPTVGLNTYSFTTPFNWNGTSNIVIQICWSNVNTGGTAAEVAYNSTSFAATTYYRVDNGTSSAVCGQVTGTSITSNRPLLILAGQTVAQGPGTVNWQWNPGAVNSNSTTVIPINTGSTSSTESYTVTALDPATTCTNSAVVTVSVLPFPTVIATASSASVCAGSSATLTATGATNYTWTSGGNTATEVVTPSSLTSYTVTGETSGCSNTSTVSVGVNAIPTVTASASSSSVCAGSAATLTAGGATNYTWTSGGNTSTEVVTPSSLTSYTVTGETSGCSNTSTVSIDVAATPTVTATASSASVCAGSSATLTAGGATNYTWTSGGNTSTEVVTPGSASVYTVTGENGGCSNTAMVSVGVNQIPTVSATASQTLLCDNGSTGSSILTAASSATIYAWSDGANTMTTSVTPTTTTIYTVTVTEAGCSANAFVTVTVSNCNGIKELVINGINVYPNPTNGVLNISISSELTGMTSIEVYDAIGKLVINEVLTTTTTTINTTKLADGIYTFKVINDNKAVKIGKIVKQ
jgi:hypothetical protein